MRLPEFNENGDLPVGVYRATWHEVLERFDHPVAQARYGASVFWIKPSALIADQLDDFIAHWQVKRDGSKRGIIEVLL